MHYVAFQYDASANKMHFFNDDKGNPNDFRSLNEFFDGNASTLIFIKIKR